MTYGICTYNKHWKSQKVNKRTPMFIPESRVIIRFRNVCMLVNAIATIAEQFFVFVKEFIQCKLGYLSTYVIQFWYYPIFNHAKTRYTVLHMFRQVLFWAKNQGNYQKFKKSLLSYKLCLVFMRMKHFFFFLKKNLKWPT